MQKVITPPITGRLTGRAELNKIMLHQKRGPKGTRFKIHQNLQRQTGLAFEAKAFCCSWRHFPLSNVFKEKITFSKYFGGVQSFWRFPFKRKVTRETTLRSNRMENQTWKPLKICFLRTFPRQSQALAQTLFSSVQDGKWSGIRDRALKISGKTPQINYVM